MWHTQSVSSKQAGEIVITTQDWRNYDTSRRPRKDKNPTLQHSTPKLYRQTGYRRRQRNVEQRRSHYRHWEQATHPP